MSSEIYNDCTVVRISNNVVYQLTKPIFKVREDEKNTFNPEWPKIKAEYNGEKISRPGILVEG